MNTVMNSRFYQNFDYLSHCFIPTNSSVVSVETNVFFRAPVTSWHVISTQMIRASVSNSTLHVFHYAITGLGVVVLYFLTLALPALVRCEHTICDVQTLQLYRLTQQRNKNLITAVKYRSHPRQLMISQLQKRVKLKSIPFTDLDRSWGSQKVEAPRFQNSQYMKVLRLSVLRTGRLCPLGNIPGTHFC